MENCGSVLPMALYLQCCSGRKKKEDAPLPPLCIMTNQGRQAGRQAGSSATSMITTPSRPPWPGCMQIALRTKCKELPFGIRWLHFDFKSMHSVTPHWRRSLMAVRLTPTCASDKVCPTCEQSYQRRSESGVYVCVGDAGGRVCPWAVVLMLLR